MARCQCSAGEAAPGGCPGAAWPGGSRDIVTLKIGDRALVLSPPALLFLNQFCGHFRGMGQIPPSYPVAVLQEAGDVAVRGLEADEV